jgi:hypothetical protein
MTSAGGAIAAAPIWHDFMTKALGGTTVEQFQRPSGIKTMTLDAITGKRPSSGVKTVTDIFASWFNIKDIAGVTKTYRVDKLTGKLVNDACPPIAANIETRSSNPITAEIPSSDASYYRWFAPIQAWAIKNKYSAAAAPTQTDNCSDVQNQNPGNIKINPINPPTLSLKTLTYLFEVTGNAEIRSLSVSMVPKDGSQTQNDNAKPNGDGTWTATLHDILHKEYTMTVIATDVNNNKASYTATLNP